MPTNPVVSYIEKLERIKVLRDSIKNFDRSGEVARFNKIKKEGWIYHHPDCGILTMQIQLETLLDD